ncbi:hypothetical protein M8J75_002354 [Diaphorina citri]|nr:hypothetical protein M8J75_002354 [Diaphorina citri]
MTTPSLSRPVQTSPLSCLCRPPPLLLCRPPSLPSPGEDFVLHCSCRQDGQTDGKKDRQTDKKDSNTDKTDRQTVRKIDRRTRKIAIQTDRR